MANAKVLGQEQPGVFEEQQGDQCSRTGVSKRERESMREERWKVMGLQTVQGLVSHCNMFDIPILEHSLSTDILSLPM